MKKKVKNESKTTGALDGGWGWFVCLGSSLITFSLRSLDPSFGLIFRSLLIDLHIDSTKQSVILSVMDACNNFSGLMVGPLLNRYSCRTVAVFGASLACCGLILTAFADSFLYIVITYGICNGVGVGLSVAAAFVALNSYFSKKRGQAVSFSSAGTALAMMLVPQAAHFFLSQYDFRGTMLLFGGLAMHSIAGACLLRPLPTKKIDEKTTAVKVLDVNHEEPVKKNDECAALLMAEQPNEKLKNEKDKLTNHVKEVKDEKFFKFITELFDVELLKNYSYLNVIIGLSLYNIAESNFKLMMPFFLNQEIGMDEGNVAFCLSLMAFTDIVARIVLPILYDRLGFKKRRLFWINALFVAIGRSIMAEMSKGIAFYVVLVVNGFIRGATIQNLQLSVSETCTLEMLPHAYGLFMVSKGLFSLTCSPFVGYVRDYSGSYKICLHAMSIIILICFISWGIEFLWKSISRRRGRLLPTHSELPIKEDIMTTS